MPSVVEAVAKDPAAQQARLVVYISQEDAAWLEDVRRRAKARGKMLSASAVVRAAIQELRKADQELEAGAET